MTRSNIACLLLVAISLVPNPTFGQASIGIVESEPTGGPSVKVEGGWMVPYSERIPGTDIHFEMTPVPGGTFLMGSPDSEPGRQADEGPPVKVVVAPMWVGKLEVTQLEYAQYEQLHTVFKEIEREHPAYPNLDRDRFDVVTAPTEIYDRSVITEFGSAPDHPAVGMTQYAAQQYTKWLSVLTQRQYRLPTEGEWEYACRAGSQTRFFWGDDEQQASQFAWYKAGSESVDFSRGGLKSPNTFGIHDMLGSVAEWTVNAHTRDGYASLQSKQPIQGTDAGVWPRRDEQGVVRGGCLEFDLAGIRCAARLAADDDQWKNDDPDFPPSPWWYTTFPATAVGFRVFRSLEPLSPETISNFWNGTSSRTRDAVREKLSYGRGAVGIVNDEVLRKLEVLRAKHRD